MNSINSKIVSLLIINSGVIMDTKLKVNDRILNPKISNNVYNSPSSEQIVERQMISYMNIFKNIADQISDLNNQISDAAE